MHKKIETICGYSEFKPDFEAIGNNPNFVFENDPSYEAVRLFDVNSNIVNVNSWLECAHYVNGGWTNNYSDFINGEKFLFFFVSGLIILGVYLQKKFNYIEKV